MYIKFSEIYIHSLIYVCTLKSDTVLQRVRTFFNNENHSPPSASIDTTQSQRRSPRLNKNASKTKNEETSLHRKKRKLDIGQSDRPSKRARTVSYRGLNNFNLVYHPFNNSNCRIKMLEAKTTMVKVKSVYTLYFFEYI